VEESSPGREDEKADESAGLARKGEGSEATGQGGSPDEGHNRHRVFRAVFVCGMNYVKASHRILKENISGFLMLKESIKRYLIL